MSSLWLKRQEIVKARGPLICLFCEFIIALTGIAMELLGRISNHVQDITRLWKDQPIVAIYASSSYQGETCSIGYEALPFVGVSLPSITQASCGCTENPYGFSSSIEPCPAEGLQSGYCTSLSPLNPPEGLSWRGSTLCVKRAGRPAATYKGHYSGRSHPDKHGKCPNKYKKCGNGRNQDEGAICFPDNTECPITNIMVLPSTVSPSSNEGWEPAGSFVGENRTLYFRREHIGELPLLNVTIALTEIVGDCNIRGQCFRGETQSPGQIQASLSSLWTYVTRLPLPCETSDPRYILVDEVPLENAYLKSIQVMEPTCSELQLYAFDDPRYNKTSDPDYLNSGVKCGSDPRYACVRDPYQNTNCIAGDEICDGVVNQNICGEYAHAVRSAFSNSAVTLGLYYVREIEWSDHCDVSKRAVFNYRKLPFQQVMFQISMVVLFFMLPSLIFSLMGFEPDESHNREHYNYYTTSRQEKKIKRVPTIVYVVYIVVFILGTICLTILQLNELYSLYEAMKGGECTDDFTAEIIMSRLFPIPQAFWVCLLLFSLIAVAAMLIALMVRRKELQRAATQAAATPTMPYVQPSIVEVEIPRATATAHVSETGTEPTLTEAARAADGNVDSAAEPDESLETTHVNAAGDYSALSVQEL